MTNSLIRLDSIVRASLNTGLNDKAHDETRAKADARTNDNDDGITKCYNEWDWEDDAMTETDSGITRSYRGYNARTRDYDSITESYKRYNEKL